MIKIGDKVKLYAPECVASGTLGKVIDIDYYKEFGKIFLIHWQNGPGWFTQEDFKEGNNYERQ